MNSRQNTCLNNQIIHIIWFKKYLNIRLYVYLLNFSSYVCISIGTLGTIFQVYVVIGILYSFVVGSVVKYTTFNVFCGIWTILHVVLTFFIPESPYYFLYMNKDENAHASMSKLRDGNDADIASELNEIKVWKYVFLLLRMLDIRMMLHSEFFFYYYYRGKLNFKNQIKTHSLK